MLSASAFDFVERSPAVGPVFGYQVLNQFLNSDAAHTWSDSNSALNVAFTQPQYPPGIRQMCLPFFQLQE
jgi:hypothetical protein